MDFDVQHRDAFDSLAAMKAAGGVDLILTSPPYPDARENHEGYASFDTSIEGYHRLGVAVFDALKPGGVCALNIDGPVREWRGKDIGSERSLIAFEVAIDWAKSIGFRFVEHCAYVREGAPGIHGPRWRNGWEPVHIFAKPGTTPFFDQHGYKIEAMQKGRKYGKARTRAGDASSGWRNAGSGYEQGKTRCLSSAFHSHTGSGYIDQEHPAPFSRTLADAYVLCYSPPSGLVGDPFVGSGTVVLSCHRHGRRFIGGDLGHRERDSKRWVDIINEQLGQGRLFA